MNNIKQKDIIEIAESIYPYIQNEKGKSYFVTGVTSMMGRYIVEVLLYLNEKKWSDMPCRIIGVARNANVFNDIKNSNLIILEHDICDSFTDLERTEIDYIIHIAGDADIIHQKISPAELIQTNVIGTLNVLEVAQQCNVKSMLYVSSGSVYARHDRKILKESDFMGSSIPPNCAQNCYIESKRLCETLCASYFEEYKVKVKIVRPFLIYGPDIKVERKGLFQDIIGAIEDGKEFIMRSEGHALRNFCYITDCVSAMFIVLLNGKNGEAYNVAGSCTMEVKELVQCVKRVLNGVGKDFGLVYRVDEEKGQELNYYPDIEKIYNLGYRPQVDVEEGIERMLLSRGII